MDAAWMVAPSSTVYKCSNIFVPIQLGAAHAGVGRS